MPRCYVISSLSASCWFLSLSSHTRALLGYRSPSLTRVLILHVLFICLFVYLFIFSHSQDDSKASIIVGHHKLEGTKVDLEKPLVVLKRKKEEDGEGVKYKIQGKRAKEESSGIWGVWGGFKSQFSSGTDEKRSVCSDFFVHSLEFCRRH